MKTRKTVLIAIAVVLVAGLTLFAQRPVAGSHEPGDNPLMMMQGQGMSGAAGGFGLMAGRMSAKAGLVRYLVRQYLDFTPAQEATLEEARKSGREELRGMFVQMRQNRKAIREAVLDGQPVDALADSQGKLIAELIKEVSARVADTKAKLNLAPEQEEKIEQLRKHFEQRMSKFAGRAQPSLTSRDPGK